MSIIRKATLSHISAEIKEVIKEVEEEEAIILEVEEATILALLEIVKIEERVKFTILNMALKKKIGFKNSKDLSRFGNFLFWFFSDFAQNLIFLLLDFKVFLFLVSRGYRFLSFKLESSYPPIRKFILKDRALSLLDALKLILSVI